MKALQKDTLYHWRHIAKVIRVPHNEKEYDDTIKILNELIDTVGQDEYHPLADLLELVACCAEAYENIYYVLPKTSPTAILKSLMTEHHLTQKDLKEIGTQSVVSQVLNKKRKLNLRQIRNLAKRFHLDEKVFIQ